MRLKQIFLLVMSGFFLFMLQPFTEVKAANLVKVENLEELTKEVTSSLKNLNTEKTIQYVGETENITQQVKKIIPEIIQKHDEVAGTLKSYKYQIMYTQDNAQLTYYFTYYTSKEKSQKAGQLLNKVAQQIMKTNKTDYERVKAVNDYVVSNTQYGGKTRDRYTVYGLLTNKQAVCQGYALTVYDLLTRMKIPVRYVVGTSLGQNHAWNKVKVDGKWYNLDSTWNDPLPNRPTEVNYNYFLISDRVFSKDHTWKKENYPVATSTKYDFLADTGSAIQVGNLFYYSNSKDQHRLYAYDIKLAKKTKLSNVRVQYITYSKGKLYFSNYSNGAYLYRIDTSGKNLKKIATRAAKNIAVKGSYIYYQSGAKMYKVKV